MDMIFYCIVSNIKEEYAMEKNNYYYGGNKPFSMNASPRLFLGDAGCGTVDISSSGGRFNSSRFN